MNKIASSDMLMEKIAGLINIKEADKVQGCIPGKTSPITQDDVLKVAGLVGRVKLASKGGGGGNLTGAVKNVWDHLKKQKAPKSFKNVNVSAANQAYRNGLDALPSDHIMLQRKGLLGNLENLFNLGENAKSYQDLMLQEGWHPWLAKSLGAIQSISPFGLTPEAVLARKAGQSFASKGMSLTSSAADNYFGAMKTIRDRIARGEEIPQDLLNTVNQTHAQFDMPFIGGFGGGATPAELNQMLSDLGSTGTSMNKLQKRNSKLETDLATAKGKTDRFKTEAETLRKQIKADKEQRIQDQLNTPWWQNPGAAATLGAGAGAAGLYGTSAMMNALSNRNDDRRRPAIML